MKFSGFIILCSIGSIVQAYQFKMTDIKKQLGITKDGPRDGEALRRYRIHQEFMRDLTRLREFYNTPVEDYFFPDMRYRRSVDDSEDVHSFTTTTTTDTPIITTDKNDFKEDLKQSGMKDNSAADIGSKNPGVEKMSENAGGSSGKLQADVPDSMKSGHPQREQDWVDVYPDSIADADEEVVERDIMEDSTEVMMEKISDKMYSMVDTNLEFDLTPLPDGVIKVHSCRDYPFVFMRPGLTYLIELNNRNHSHHCIVVMVVSYNGLYITLENNPVIDFGPCSEGYLEISSVETEKQRYCDGVFSMSELPTNVHSKVAFFSYHSKESSTTKKSIILHVTTKYAQEYDGQQTSLWNTQKYLDSRKSIARNYSGSVYTYLPRDADYQLCPGECGKGNYVCYENSTEESNDQKMPHHNLPEYYPWFISVELSVNGMEDPILLGGTILDSRTVLTAAHPILKEDCGNVDILVATRLNEEEEPLQIVHVESYIVHKNYKNNGSHYEHDLLILKLEDALKFGHFTSPACLGPRENYNGRILSSFSYHYNPKMDRFLFEKEEHRITNGTSCCKQFVTNSLHYVKESQTSSPTPPGTPLMIREKNVWYLAGIVSSEVKPNHVVAVNVSNYLSFIDEYTRAYKLFRECS